MFDEDVFTDVLHWFTSKLKTESVPVKMSKELWNHVKTNCVLVPGPNEAQVWYHPERNSFYKVKSANSLVCAHRPLFGVVGPSQKGKKLKSEQGDCKANLSLSQNDDQLQHNHARCSVEQAQRLCFNWAVNLLTCAVGDSTWLAMGVGYLASFWPKETLFPNLVDRKSHIDTALRLAPKRSADEKKRYLEVFTVDNLLRFCALIRESSIFRDVPLDARNQWGSFGQAVNDLISGALNWQHPRISKRNDQLLPSAEPRNDEAEVAQLEHSTIGSSVESLNQRPSTSRGAHQLRARAPTDQPAASTETCQTSVVSLPSGVDESDSAEKEPVRVARRKSGKRLLRLTPTPRKFRSKPGITKKPSPQKPQAEEPKPGPSSSLLSSPDSMKPVVVLHRLSSGQLAELKSQNGVIRVTNEKTNNKQDGATAVKRRRTGKRRNAIDDQDEYDPHEGTSRTSSVIRSTCGALIPLNESTPKPSAVRKQPKTRTLLETPAADQSTDEFDEDSDAQETSQQDIGRGNSSVTETTIEKGSFLSNTTGEHSALESSELVHDLTPVQMCQVFGLQNIAGSVVDGQYDINLNHLPPAFRDIDSGMTLFTRIISKRRQGFTFPLRKLNMCIEDLSARSVIHIGMLHVYSETTNSVEKVSEDAKEKLDDGEEGLIKPVTVEGTKWDITHAEKYHGKFVIDQTTIPRDYLPKRKQEVLSLFLRFKEEVDRESILTDFRQWFDVVVTRSHISKSMYSAFWPRT